MLVNIIQTYLKLNPREQREYEAMLEQPENQAVRAAQFTWAEEVFHEGEKRGEHKGGILTLCEVLNIELTPERRARLEQLDLDHLSALLAHLKSHRAWPDN